MSAVDCLGRIGAAHLFPVSHAPEEEGHAEDEEQIGQDGAQQRGLDDADLVLVR